MSYQFVEQREIVSDDCREAGSVVLVRSIERSIKRPAYVAGWPPIELLESPQGLL